MKVLRGLLDDIREMIWDVNNQGQMYEIESIRIDRDYSAPEGVECYDVRLHISEVVKNGEN